MSRKGSVTLSGLFGYLSPNKEVLNTKVDLKDFILDDSQYINERLAISNANMHGYIFRSTVNKFMDDKAFEQNSETITVLDGVILNMAELKRQMQLTKDNSMADVTDSLTRFDGPFFKYFKGSFAGAYLDKRLNRFTLYTDQIGDKEVLYYYHQQSNVLYFGTTLFELVRLIQKHLITNLTLNKNAAYSLLTHGHVLCNETLVNEISRLTPGHYLTFDSNGIQKLAYYQLSNRPIEIDENEAISKIDYYFRNAIQLEFEKDREYGYKHLVALSGGLDARMTTWVAHELGYTEMLNYTFSQTDYLDEKISKQIAQDLNHEWLFKALDNGVYLYRYFDEAISLSGGMSRSASLTHTLSMLDQINFKQYGLVHTGQLGDVILGTYYKEGHKNNFYPGAGADSCRFVDKVHYSKENAVNISDEELFKFYNRGFTGINAGLIPMQKYTETISPFLDIDFLNFCLSLPIKYRHGHYIYIKWINKYYPEAADYVYEKVNGKINKKIITLKGVPIPWTSVPQAGLKFLKKKFKINLRSKWHMNPLDYWYSDNLELAQFYDDIFEQNIDLIQDSALKADCRRQFNEGTTGEKDQVITLLGSISKMKSIS